MSRKDVELIIRAKDEATKAVSAVTKAINSLSDSQAGLVQTASKSDTALSRLGAAFNDLDRAMRGTSAASQIAKQLDNATKAAGRLEAAVAETAAQLSTLEKQTADVGRATAGLVASADKAAAAVERETAALRKAKEAVAAQSSAYNRAVADRKKLVDADARLTQQITEQQSKLDKAAAGYNKLNAEIAAAAQPSEKLQKSLARAAEAVGRQEAALNELVTTQGVVRSAISQTDAAVDRLADSAERSVTALKKQEAAVSDAATQYTELKAAAATSAKSQRDIADESERLTGTLARQEQALERAQIELAQLGVAAGKADVAVSKLSDEMRSAMLKDFGQVAKAVGEVRAEWKQNEAAVKTLAASMTRIGPPTREQAIAWNQATTAARASRQEYDAQTQGLQRLRTALRQPAEGLDELRAKFEAFTAIQGRTGTTIAEIRSRATDLVRAFEKLAGAGDRAGRSIRDVGGRAAIPPVGPVNALSEAWKAVYGNTRTAMSWTQRLRGEVLSLVAAYGGMYGVIDLLNRTVGAYQKLEAAQSRLGAVFNQDQDRVGQEIDFIRRNADRLGVEFGQLADEYTKFAAATKGTNLEGENTRKIFLAVAEAARVNKLQFEDVQGVFRALTQIASKGRVQLEELSGQLGDRLPGALKIMADGLGVTTEELLDMTKKGEVSADQLVKFAEELERRYGPQLAAALQSTTTQMGQLQNAAFQALIVFANGGFLESFNGLLRDLTTLLKSADFQTFSQNASAAFGKVIDLLGFLATNFDLVIAAMAAFAGFKLGGALAALTTGLLASIGGLTKLRAAFVATQLSAVAAGASLGVATTALGALRVALMALLSGTGVGLLLTAVGAAIGLWATRADEATEAMTRHREIMDKVKNAYEQAEGSASKFAKALKDVSVSQAVASLQELQKALKTLREDTSSGIFDFAERSSAFSAFALGGTELAKEQHESLKALREEFKRGNIDAAKYKEALDKIAQAAATPQINAFALQLQEVADAGIKLERSIAEGTAAVDYLKDPTDKAAASTAGLVTTFDNTSTAAQSGAKALSTYNEAIDTLKKAVPELAEELKKLGELDAINKAYKDAVGAARTIGQANEAWNAYQKALTGYRDNNTNYERMYSNQRFSGEGVKLERLVRLITDLAEKMGLSAKDLLTAISFETGGTFNPNQMGGADGKYRGLIQFSPDNQAKYGIDGTETIEQHLAAIEAYLKAAGVKEGDGLAQIYAAILAGDARKTNASDIANGGVVSNVMDAVGGPQFDGHEKRVEGILKAYAGITEEVKKQAKEQEKAAEQSKKQKEDTAKRLEDGKLAIEQQNLINQGKEREAEIQKAIQEAKAENPNITAEEIAKIREQTGALFDLKAAQEADNEKKRAANEALREANALMQQSAALRQQAKAEIESGNPEGAQTAIAELDEVNLRLQEAIAKARAMWEAIGGPEAAAKLVLLDALAAKLGTAGIKADELKNKAQQNLISWKEVGELFANLLVSAIDRFAQAIAEGKSASEAAREAFLQFAADFLKQIAQMILKALILKALNFFFPGMGFGAGHTGGLVGSKRIGSGNQTRNVSPMAFMGAARYHTGGLPGLRANEVPAILQKGEEVLTGDDPRNILNGGATPGNRGATQPQDVKIVNLIDSGSMLTSAMDTRAGQKAFLNFIQTNSAAVKKALNN